MPTVINGSGTISGLQNGGLNDGVITQSEIGNGVVGTGPAFSAYQATAQSIGSAETLITLDTKEFDTANCFNTASSRFTPTVPGYYLLSGNAQISVATGGFYACIYKNGAVIKFGTYVPVTASGVISAVSAIVFLNGSTDYVELRASSATAGNTIAGSQRVSFFGCLVRAADVKPASIVAPTTTNGPAFSVYRTAAQSIPFGAQTKLQLNLKEFDTANCYDAITNYRFQPNVAGYYQLTGQAALSPAAATGGPMVAYIYKNGTIIKRSTIAYMTNSDGAMTEVNALVFLNGSTDYVELYVYNGNASSTALNTSSFNAGAENRFSGFLARLP